MLLKSESALKDRIEAKGARKAMDDSSNCILQVGTVLEDKWVILELIDRGGMGEVYRAHQLNLKRDIALKVISQEWLNSLDGDLEEIETGLQRFRREVQAMAQIRHPNIVQVFDHGSFVLGNDGEEVTIEYIAMEYIPGASLRSTMSQEGFYPDEDTVREWLSNYFLPLLDGVQAMHEVDIVHRDLKPENVLLDGSTPKIADFGLARSCRFKPVTRSVDVKGTPPYMSPEQFFDFGRVDQRADIYSLGKILYESLCGKIPPGATPFQKACLANPEKPFFQGLNLIIQDATAKDRGNRTFSVEELRTNLIELIQGRHREASLSENAVLKGKKGKNRKKFFLIGTIIVVLSGALHVSYHSLIRDHTERSAVPSLQISPPVSSTTANDAVQRSALEEQNVPLPETITADNSTTFRLIPGGRVALTQDLQGQPGPAEEIKSFYMSETPVTNQQYVDFLNQVLSEIKIEEGHVVHDGKIWLRLGEVFSGYKPIVYREGRFHVKEAMHAACPVIRVTGYGAAAYGRHYGMRLPTDVEWLYVIALDTQSRTSRQGDPTAGIEQLPLQIPTPVVLYQPNSYGIRALNQNMGEWGSAPQTEGLEKDKNEYVVLGGLQPGSETNNSNPTVIRRSPEKSYADVGFRTVLSTRSSS